MRLCRKRAKISLDVLERLSGVDRSTINSWEHGKRNPNVRSAQLVADALKIPLSRYLGLDITEDGVDYGVMQDALSYYGLHTQTNICIEELSELQKELCKFNRSKQNINSIAEKIADVQIYVEQMKLGFKCEEAVRDWSKRKLRGLKKDLEDKRNARI